MTERNTEDRIAALEQARAHIETALRGNVLAGDPLYRSWQLLNQAIGDLRAEAARPQEMEPGTAPDDLTLVRGIGRELARRLAERGVASFAQIAAWGPDDVRDMAEALGLGRQISRQNWIEQAALLDLRRPAGDAAPAPPAEPASRPVATRTAGHSIGLDQILAQIRNDPALRPPSPDRQGEHMAPVAAVERPDRQPPDPAVEHRGQRDPEVLDAARGSRGSEGGGALPPEPEESTVTFVIRERDPVAYADDAFAGTFPAPPRFAAASAAGDEGAAYSAPPGIEPDEAEVVIVSRAADARSLRRPVKAGRN